MADDTEAVARHELDAAAAREGLLRLAGDGTSLAELYATICRWTWRALVESRLDSELRSWHGLILDLAARVSSQGGSATDERGRARLTGADVAARLRGFADLVRMSVEAADASVPREIAGRAHVIEILRSLAERADGYVERSELKSQCGLKDSNLSRVLTLLSMNGLVEREPRGKRAGFKITARGLEAANVRDRTLRGQARPHFGLKVVSGPDDGSGAKSGFAPEGPRIVGYGNRIGLRPSKQAYGGYDRYDDRYDAPPIVARPAAAEAENG